MLALLLTWAFPVLVVYLGLFATLWLRVHFLARRGRTSRAAVQVRPWNGHLYISAPDDATAADALLRADLELAGRGR